MPVLRDTPANTSMAPNASNHLQEAMMASAASVLYVLLLMPALARNQSIGYLPPYLPYPAASPAALPTPYPGYPGYGYPTVGQGLPPVYAPAGSLPSSPPFSVAPGGSQAVSPLAQLGLGFTGYGFPGGWPARPLGPLAAALATAYPSLFAALTGPCRSWCRAPSLPLFFPPSNAESESEQVLAFPLRPMPVLGALRALRALRSALRPDREDGGAAQEDRGPILRLLFPEE